MKKWKWDFWEEGEYIDLWCIPHFLCGVFLAEMGYLAEISFLTSISVATLGMIAWELIEMILDVGEGVPNKIMDVFIGVVGFLVMWGVVSELDFITNFTFFWFVGILLGLLVLWGYVAAMKRTNP